MDEELLLKDEQKKWFLERETSPREVAINVKARPSTNKKITTHRKIKNMINIF